MAVYRRSIVWRLACDPPARLWSGDGDLLVTDTLDPAGATYRSAAALLEVPDLKVLMNGLADRVDFSVSGVSPETVRLALEDRYTIKGADLRVGHVLFDADWQLIAPPSWEWRGRADVLTTKSEDSDSSRSRTIAISVANADTRRANTFLTYYTDQDQRRAHPTDAIFDHVAGISQGSTRRWGAKS